MMKQKKIPQRTCVGCRETRAKRELIRIVRTPESGIEIDTGGRRSGRGAYICPSVSCLESAVKGGRLASALETEIPAAVFDSLRKRLGSDAG